MSQTLFQLCVLFFARELDRLPDLLFAAFLQNATESAIVRATTVADGSIRPEIARRITSCPTLCAISAWSVESLSLGTGCEQFRDLLFWFPNLKNLRLSRFTFMIPMDNTLRSISLICVPELNKAVVALCAGERLAHLRELELQSRTIARLTNDAISALHRSRFAAHLESLTIVCSMVSKVEELRFSESGKKLTLLLEQLLRESPAPALPRLARLTLLCNTGDMLHYYAASAPSLVVLVLNIHHELTGEIAAKLGCLRSLSFRNFNAKPHSLANLHLGAWVFERFVKVLLRLSSLEEFEFQPDANMFHEETFEVLSRLARIKIDLPSLLRTPFTWSPRNSQDYLAWLGFIAVSLPRTEHWTLRTQVGMQINPAMQYQITFAELNVCLQLATHLRTITFHAVFDPGNPDGQRLESQGLERIVVKGNEPDLLFIARTFHSCLRLATICFPCYDPRQSLHGIKALLLAQRVFRVDISDSCLVFTRAQAA